MEPLLWSGYEYEFREKSPDWYWALGIVALAAAITAAIAGNALLAALIIVAAFTMALFATKRPTHTEFVLNDRGLVIGVKLYPYETLESYWIYGPEEKEELIVKSQKPLMPLILIPLEGVSATEVEKRLSLKLTKEEHVEPLSHRVMEFFGV